MASRSALIRTTAWVMRGRYRAAVRYPGQQARRATVVGAGSFGTAVSLLLVRAGVSATLLCRTQEQAEELDEKRENERYLEGVELPRELNVRAFGSRRDQFARPDLVFLAVPSRSSAGWACPSAPAWCRWQRAW